MTDQPWWLKQDVDLPIIGEDDTSTVRVKRVDTPFVLICNRGHFLQIQAPENGATLHAWLTSHAKCEPNAPRAVWRTWVSGLSWAAFGALVLWIASGNAQHESHGQVMLHYIEGTGVWILVGLTYSFVKYFYLAWKKAK